MARLRRWKRLDVPGIETFREDGRSFEGVVRVEAPPAWEASYRVLFDDSWTTVAAEASVRDADRNRPLGLRREPSGRWFDGEREIESCRGALDIDLGLTPSTNTSAIRRLGLVVGGRAELTAAWVRFPQLTVEPLRQRYTRLAAREYLYESLRDGQVGFRARLEVDVSDLVIRYQGLFERIDRPD
ncbi:MAG TPA: putative glycolipid-binding domain-containing protein [Myxococcaceae bacterium]|nr:putative glycolipid-binding domain-containing protein [Myxococcaceae bacterium]